MEGVGALVDVVVGTWVGDGDGDLDGDVVLVSGFGAIVDPAMLFRILSHLLFG